MICLSDHFPCKRQTIKIIVHNFADFAEIEQIFDVQYNPIWRLINHTIDAHLFGRKVTIKNGEEAETAYEILEWNEKTKILKVKLKIHYEQITR